MNSKISKPISTIELKGTELLDVSGGGNLKLNDLGFYLSGVGGTTLGYVVAGAVFGSAAGPVGSLVGAIIGGGVYWLIDQF
ncbi:hypothetical protein COB47_1154 [Caldicellulosiruptor obsidiansis OB47]|uniref:Uncharacterized protein n=1 Tax=Caldicellulosiruptor obsidiansis (strain ATCC BAA-2073 / JCM 16842 / OB47) TaxID=608506 RepID=D9TKC1_CALOO|nr:hypothetical protein [Caldicellulosiruptor obsidiansis]ADL42453.1 hypothetical protein COB47_1154 [Caldicellulosiruptor obsidiansis OB47]